MKISEMFDIEDPDDSLKLKLISIDCQFCLGSGKIDTSIDEFELEMIRASCRAYTFDDPKVMKLIRSLVEGPSVVNLYAGKNVVFPDEIRVDVRSFMFNLTHNMTDAEFISLAKQKGWLFQTFIYDPPWDGKKSKKKRKAYEFYNGNSGSEGIYTKYKDDVASLVPVGGIIISAGYEIDVFGKKRGMVKEKGKAFVINPSGEQRPFYVIVERRIK